MPSSPNYKRNLEQEKRTAKRRGDPKRNASRKRARRAYEKAKGKCSGDVHHRDGNAMNNAPSNLVCRPASKNRSFARTKSAGKKNPRS